MRNSKIIYVLIACLVLSVACVCAAIQPIKLDGKLVNYSVPKSPGSVDSFVLASFDDDTYQLELDFLGSAEDLTIEIWGDDGIRAFYVTTDVTNGLQVFADLSNSNAGAFEVYIYNKEGIYITGYFELL